MSRILITWELGGHLGHLGRLLPVAEAVRQAGHEILFAVCNMRSAAQVLTPRGFEYVQAPLLSSAARLRQPPASYAELLLAEGFGDRDGLSGVLRAWERMFQLYCPDLVLADHSPSVLLGVRHCGIRAVPIGNGFEIPPDTSPMPSIRVWEKIEQTRLARSEARALQTINQCVGGAARLERLADLFHRQPAVIATFAELDHYRERGPCDYAGPLFSPLSAAPCPWPGSGRRRIFGYLHNGLPGLANLLEALRQLDAEIVCVITGLSEAACRSHSSHNLTLLARPIDIQSALGAAHLGIAQGGTGANQFLLAGVPLLLIPATVEQFLLCQRIQELGAGIYIGNDRSSERFGGALRQLLEESTHQDMARVFAGRYRGFRTNVAAARAAALIERQLSPAALH